MAEIQLFYIGTSKTKEVRSGASITYAWGAYSKWKNFKNPIKASSKKVTYSKTAKNKAGASAYGGVGGVTVLGSSIPATAQRTIGGVPTTVDVRYYKRGYTKYIRTTELKNVKKMLKTVYTKAHPYQYRLQYKDKVIKDTTYSTYEDGIDYIFFADHYYKNGVLTHTSGHLPHPTTCDVTYSEVRRNIDTSNTNNGDGRDNKGTYVLANVRTNVVTISLEWEGLSAEEGTDLLDTLNPDANHKYLVVQYRDPATGKAKNKTFYADSRSARKTPSGLYESISVTLTEV